MQKFKISNFIMQAGDNFVVDEDDTLEGILKRVPKTMCVGTTEGVYKLIAVVTKKSRKEIEIKEVNL